ncbi:hypothetical protein KEM55_004242 [Ascosphaera atra]|nr:hypothetical protein KEM55_004242 [Ascosphaera atra]
MGKGKKARHSRSVSWHPAWRPDDDSDDDSDGGQPTATTNSTPAWLKEQRPKKQSLHEVKEEDAENAGGPQAQAQAQGQGQAQGQAHQVHQQARSEPYRQAAAAQSSSPSQVGGTRDDADVGDGAGDAGAQQDTQADTQADTQTHSRAPTSETQAASEAASAASATSASAASAAAAAAEAGVDTVSISSPVSFSPHPSAHNSGFHVQSGAPAASVTTTATTTTAGSVETAMPTSDDEKGEGKGNVGVVYDEEDSFMDDQFPETIVIEEEEDGESRLREEGFACCI